MRRRPIVVGGLVPGLIAVLASAALRVAPLVVWNTTASAPMGLYRLEPEPVPMIGDFVFVRPPPALAARLATAGFLPRGALLLKQIAAVAPSVGCRTGDRVTLDGQPAARALDRDRYGRPLPVWSGCRRLADGEVFFLNEDPRSLDSRYFGPLPASGIVGWASPLWLFGNAADAR
ncbi:MAG TPA: S26 family signal peptidase [Caulobacteraceae bacterium]|jgi:type IV secretory pathway protease TraF